MRRFTRNIGLIVVSSLLLAAPAWALGPRQKPQRFDPLVRVAPTAGMPQSVRTATELASNAAQRQAWEEFFSEQGGGWTAFFDERSGLPSLASGRGIPWVAGRGNALRSSGPVTVDSLEKLARSFMDAHPKLLGTLGSQLVLDRAASGRLGASDAWQVTFRQVVGGVPVEGARYNFHVSHGNLVAFGASHVAPVTRGVVPQLTADQAREALDRYLGITRGELSETTLALLQLLPVDPRGTRAAWDGAIGAGYDHALAWQFTLREAGEPATWVAQVSADTGEVLAFYDDTRYDSVQGGVYPETNDGLDPAGVEQPGWPLPWADYTENGGPVQYSGSGGQYACSTTGSTIRTTLAGKYIRVSDNCGPASETTTCDNPLDLGLGPGTDCVVPPGHSAGDTHSARSSFYHLNRSMQTGRAWLPDNTWLQSQVTDNININSTCNAYWSGSVNFYRSGGGCANTGELAGVFVHEWGHGIDQNDGGGYDNPSEGYADIVAVLYDRGSCVGRGFYLSQQCSGYGDACLNCTGIRDQDWDKHVSHTPATATWAQSHCGGGGGPCGYEPHCEAYIAAEAIYDLATRDFVNQGMDPDTAWQETEQLWFLSRKGSGGNAYNCSGTNSDGCNSDSWFHKFMLVDDDDGSLANGTPHAAAIFAAFNRHRIACGTASDASNQNSNSCPALAKPQIGVQASTNTNTVTWNAVPNAASYLVLRNDAGCNRTQQIVGQPAAPATSFADTPVANGFTLFYRVQAVGPQRACVSPVSDCVSSAAQPFAGAVRFDQPTYGCSAQIALHVTDGNVGAPTVTVTVWSDSETAPETITLTQAAPGSAKYMGFIAATTAPAVHGDGALTIKDGDGLHAQYVDADDGAGNHNVPTTDQALADCVAPAIANVADVGTTDTATTLQWSTNEVSDSVAVWGPAIPPSTTTLGNRGTLTHQVALGGLTSCTTYWYEVHSTDPAGNLAISNNGGNYFHFETLKDFGFGPQPCHAGRVTIDKPVVFCSDVETFKLVDQDLNANPNAVDTAFVYVTSTTETTPEKVLMTETGANTSVFTGSIHTALGTPAPDGQLQVANGDVLTATYFDANDGTGARATSYANANLDCSGPQVSNLQVQTITDARGTVHFTTQEPGDTFVDWGTTPALGQTLGSTALTTTHDLVLNQFTTCQDVYFRVRTRDQFGNPTTVDNHGSPFVFHTGLIPGLYFKDSFEAGNNGWTLGGEWQIDSPRGKGGSSGLPDPANAYNNSKLLGHDLTGLGTYPGDYEPGVVQSAKSKVFDATTWVHTKLLFYRRLQSGNGDEASIWVYSPQGLPLYRETTGVSDSVFTTQSYDLSSIDGKPTVQIEFREKSNTSGQFSGWNIDDFILKDGSKPDYSACTDCGSAPSFAGATSALDNNACAAAGVTVSWNGAASWGSAAGGTYDVYRGTSPGFPADAAHLVKSGVVGLSYNDTTAPTGQLYYLVRAESSETCSTGPANHGVLDTNTTYAAVNKTTSRPAPGTIGTLGVLSIDRTHVRLTWAAPSDAASYNVYRSTAPAPAGFGLVNSTTGQKYDDLGAAVTRENYFYTVRAVNACGVETP